MPKNAPSQQPLLSIRNLDIAFGTRSQPLPTVHDVSFDIYPGETVAIVGESGSGKSTTAHAIIDLLPGTGHVTGGHILFHGKDLVGADDATMTALRGNDIGLVPQDPMTNLNPVWTIGRQITEALHANGVTRGKKETEQRACELLDEAGIPHAQQHMKHYPHEFSGGMCQRALIAIGLHARPSLLIADEPTSALDVTVQQQILDHLEGLIRELGTAVLLITHDLGLAAERASRIIVMKQGRIVEQGPSADIIHRPQHPYTQQLISAAPSLTSQRTAHSPSASTVLTPSAGRNDIATARTSSTTAPARQDVLPRQELLSVDNVTHTFRLPQSRPWKKLTTTALDDVSLSVRQLTTTAIVGESGSGKSTLASIMLGLLSPTSGSVHYMGTSLTEMSRDQEMAFRRAVQPVFQNPYGTLDPMWSVYNIIEEPLVIHKLGDRASRRRRVADIMEKVALPSSLARRYPQELSGGQRQRVAIARALVLEPEIVICDEAVSALDVIVQAQILELLAELQYELGLTYLFITHDLAVVKNIADEVVVMKQGKIVEQGETDSLYENPQTEYTQRLLDAIPGAGLL